MNVYEAAEAVQTAFVFDKDPEAAFVDGIRVPVEFYYDEYDEPYVYIPNSYPRSLNVLSEVDSGCHGITVGVRVYGVPDGVLADHPEITFRA